MSERVLVTIGCTGKVTVEADGVTGSGCEALTKPLVDLFGSGERERKPEYYEQAEQQQQQSW